MRDWGSEFLSMRKASGGPNVILRRYDISAVQCSSLFFPGLEDGRLRNREAQSETSSRRSRASLLLPLSR
jgi:hypothetical protein